MFYVSVQAEDFDLGTEAAKLSATGAGALVTFTGLVRDVQGELVHLQIEHYPAMTEAALTQIAQEAQSRWSLSGVLVIHRYGDLTPDAQIMMVATAAPHRVDAFEAAEFLMDYLKSRAPFWKKEVTQEGATWVEAKASDEDALGRWSHSYTRMRRNAQLDQIKTKSPSGQNR